MKTRKSSHATSSRFLFAGVALFLLILGTWMNAKGETTGFDAAKRDAVSFDKHWDVYVRDLFGCPHEGPTNGNTCEKTLSRLNAAEFAKARNAAKSTFGLRD